MNTERYQELLGRLLDNDLRRNDAEELSALLSVKPHLLRDVRHHLYLWELFSQQQQPERTEAAFMAGWQTRLAAEADAATFTKRVEVEVSKKQVEPRHSWEKLFANWRMRRLVAAALCALVLLALGVYCLLDSADQPQIIFISSQPILLKRDGKEMALTAGERLKRADLLHVPEGDEALIAYSKEFTRLRVFGPATVQVLDWRQGKQFELVFGEIEATVAHQPAAKPMMWRTPQAEATVVGTELILETATNATRLDVVQGAVRLRSLDLGQSVVVTNSQTTTVTPGSPLRVDESAAGLGRILRESWSKVGGIHVGDLTHDPRFPNQPSGREYVSALSATPDTGRNYGARFRGYIHPPRTGRYTFWITASESAQVWLSTDENPRNAQMVASLSQAALPGKWDAYPWQKSAAVQLVGGRKYYIEVLHKASDQKDHCAVAWQQPGQPREVIAGEYLSPYQAHAARSEPATQRQ